MRNFIVVFLRFFILLCLSLGVALPVHARQDPGLPTISIGELPEEARHTILLIRTGGPFPYPKDGVVFGNYEGVLPKQKRGYYHEFTVKTPGVRNRGARRIITGGEVRAPSEFYYTEDHYQSFKRVKE
ncbi:ribonuclease T1 [Noviherbaspirillum humi]|uniref:Ribonuclease T1 n=1 Tax=Noviherbaspirillum humi TaxID=1688639 RepID=A0A239DX18_9BURK|nr:ribonuclease [Noviherbaspirillum humi]SNS37010.1 ribonuclease T1 [Noviherbaspirillum humi]